MADTPKSFMNFAPGFRWPNESSIPPQTVSQALNIPVHDLAAPAGVPPSTVTEKPGEPRLQKFLRDTLSALSASFELTHVREQSINWFRTAAIQRQRSSLLPATSKSSFSTWHRAHRVPAADATPVKQRTGDNRKFSINSSNSSLIALGKQFT